MVRADLGLGMVNLIVFLVGLCVSILISNMQITSNVYHVFY